MYRTLTTRSFIQLKYVKEEIEKEMKRLKQIYIIHPYITHYMYDMQRRSWSARVTYYAIARHPKRK